MYKKNINEEITMQTKEEDQETPEMTHRLEEIMQQIKNGKATGPDKITN